MTGVLPGATLGILGGGQLGRMTALAARSMGYDVHVLDPDAECAAAPLASRVVTAALDDADAAADLARRCGAVTLEIERVSMDVLQAVARHAPMRPGAAPLHVIQDRARQRAWLAGHGFPCVPWALATSADELTAAVRRLGPSIAKTCAGGYDGRGQVSVALPDESAGAWTALNTDRAVVEQRVAIAAELSVLIARRPGGDAAVFPVSHNHHEAGILAWSVLPAPVEPARAAEAEALARAIADSLAIEGLLAVELFVLVDGRLLVNELAPRPHNSFHTTERGCVTSQFEQAVRVACDLPLGSTALVQPAAIVNLLGDVWRGDHQPDFASALEIPGVRLHLYGKRGARPGRKMGHLSAIGASADEARASALAAFAAL